jgi:transposase
MLILDLSRFDAASLIAFTAQKQTDNGAKQTDAFRQDAVRIALTSGLTRKHVADALSVGKSMRSKWMTAHRDTGMASKEHSSLAQKNDHLRREDRIFTEERKILKMAEVFLAS